MRSTTFAAAFLAGLVLTGCPKDKEEDVTTAEAREALTESSDSSMAESATNSSIEISTNFTIGKAVSDAAAELKTFIGTQLPCADITLANATLTVHYGVKAGNCTYRGHTFTGSHTVTVARNETGDVLVDHTWADLSNGIVNVNGEAHVTWSLANQSRRIVHQLTWTRIATGRIGTGSGDRLQTALNGNLTEGFKVDGSRAWKGAQGEYNLAIRGVEWRWVDPVPQKGSYVLSLPNQKSLTLDFARVDEDSIRVTLTGPRGNTFSFLVHKAGTVTQAS